jgi:hypothetical protein
MLPYRGAFTAFDCGMAASGKPGFFIVDVFARHGHTHRVSLGLAGEFVRYEKS